MTNFEMFCVNTINEVEKDKVDKIKKSMIDNGYIGTPIFYTDYILLTGCHRYDALKQLADEDIEIEFEAINLTELVEKYLEENEMDYIEIQYDEINNMTEDEIINYFGGISNG